MLNFYFKICLIVRNFQIPDCLITAMYLDRSTFEITMRWINSIASCEP